MKLFTRKKQPNLLKMGERVEQKFPHRTHTYEQNVYNICSLSLNIREIQTQVVVRYCPTQMSLVYITKTTSVGRNAEIKVSPFTCQCECQLLQT